MKKLCLFLALVTLVLSLTSCGVGFDTIRRGLENGGYTYFFPVGEEEIITTISRELDGLGLEYNVHYFKKTLASEMGVEAVSIGAVIEFKSSGDLEKAFTDARGNTLISLIENYKTDKHVRGANVLVVLSKTDESGLLAAFNG